MQLRDFIYHAASVCAYSWNLLPKIKKKNLILHAFCFSCVTPPNLVDLPLNLCWVRITSPQKKMPRNSVAIVFMDLRYCELWLAAFPKNNWCIHTPWEIYIPLHLGLYTIWFKWHRHWRKWTVKRTVFENKHKAKWFDILFHLKCKWWTFRAWFTTFLKAQMFFLFGPLAQMPQIRRILCSIKKSPVEGWLLFVATLRNRHGSPRSVFLPLFLFSPLVSWVEMWLCREF